MDTHASVPRGCFIFRPPPARDEHLLSYLQRLGHSNGYLGRGMLAKFVRAVKAQLQTQNGRREFARYAGIEESTVDELRLRHQFIPGVSERPDQFARRCFFREPYSVYCSACVRERGVFRAIWNFRAVTICEVHGLWLTDRCPQCNGFIGWDRVSVSQCACGFELGAAPSEHAPADALRITQRLVAMLLSHGRGDLHAAQPFCADLDGMNALEWLALFCFLASTTRSTSPNRFHSSRGPGFEIEKTATTTAARLFRQWPANALSELNSRWGQPPLAKTSCPLISIRQLKQRPLIWHIYRPRRALSLPAFVNDMLERYVSTLTIHTRGKGLAVNPDNVVLNASMPPLVHMVEALPGIELPVDRGTAGTSLSAFMHGVRKSGAELLDLHQVEKLIRATRHQRTILVGGGFLRPIDGRRLLLSTEVDRFKCWLASLCMIARHISDAIPLSAISTEGGPKLRRILLSAQEGKVKLLRLPESSLTLDSCYVSTDSLVDP